MLTNCFRFAPRDSVPGLIAKICKYLKDHPGWSEEELEEQIKQFISNTGVESFNGRTGIVTLYKNDINNLKIASAYFAEGEETIDELNLNALYNDGVRFVFTTWNSVTSGYDLSFVLEYFDSSGEVVYYPFSSGGSGGGNIISVNGKTGIVDLNLSDILGDSGAQVKLCTATEFTSTTIETWNAYYNDGYRIVGVVNSNVTAVDYLYILKQDINNHKPIMVLGSASTSSVLSVNNQSGNVILDVVDVSENDSENEFAKLFINETEEYPIIPAADSDALGGKPPDYYATREGFDDLKNDKADNAGWAPNKNVVTDAVGKLTTEDKPTIPSKLPNPFAVTINGQSYDGSKAVEMTVSGLPDGGTTGQVLTKKSDANQDVEWKDHQGGGSDNYFGFETEKAIGKWANGKTLYRRYFSGTTSASTDDTTVSASFNRTVVVPVKVCGQVFSIYQFGGAIPYWINDQDFCYAFMGPDRLALSHSSRVRSRPFELVVDYYKLTED